MRQETSNITDLEAVEGQTLTPSRRSKLAPCVVECVTRGDDGETVAVRFTDGSRTTLPRTFIERHYRIV